MSDRILINRLCVLAHVGVPEEERARPQKLRISVEMKVESLLLAAASDEVKDTVNYYDVAETVRGVAQEKPRRLIETLAEDVAAAVLRQYPVREITVRVDKYILRNTESVAVEIRRKGLQ
jgi:dihydroneopterin aldolase